MKKIGIVGGVGWQSTVEYYSQLCRHSERRHTVLGLRGLPALPEICIESLDHATAVSYLGCDDDQKSWKRFDEYHRNALERLEASGAQIALIASNTPHHRFDSIVQGIKIPVINIVRETALEASRIGAEQALLLGTELTMKSQKFRDEFARVGVQVESPADLAIRKEVIDLITDVQLGKWRQCERLLGVIKRCIPAQFKQKPAVCLACTELPLIFENMSTLKLFEYDGLVFVNSTAIHVEAAFRAAVEDSV